jgi:protein-tyrosine-phosphatase
MNILFTCTGNACRSQRAGGGHWPVLPGDTRKLQRALEDSARVERQQTAVLINI